MQHSALLAQPHLSVISSDADGELARIQELVVTKVVVEERGDLEALLGRLLAVGAPPTPRTLDLIGHATPDQGLLVLGGWVIDGASAKVRAFFRGLAELEVLPRLGVHAVRLLGDRTAATAAGRATIGRLADILGVEVLGAREPLPPACYGAAGLANEAARALVSASELRREAAPPIGSLRAARSARLLDVDALPAAPPAEAAPPWPRRIATAEAARELLRLVSRAAGAEMPDLLAPPTCELLLPAARPGWYHAAQVLFGGELVRVHPDGADRPGVVYPVADPRALRALVERLPILPR
jgi:hypothetical protein